MAATYRQREDIRFINPYTFVPVQEKNGGERTDINQQYHEKDLHTGYLECSIYVKTPLAVPDTEKREEKENEHVSYPFFSYGDGEDKKLAIPGSSIRGTIRSVFEAATDSCMSTIRPDTKLSRRVDNKHPYDPGVLKKENGEWRLYKANRYLLASHKDGNEKKRLGYRECKETAELKQESYVGIVRSPEGYRYARMADGTKLRWGDRVDFSIYKDKAGKNISHMSRGHLIWEGIADEVTKVKNEDTGSGKTLTGYVYIGEMFADKKHGESLFCCEKEPEKYASDELKKALEELKETLEIYRDKAINKTEGHSSYKDFERTEWMQAIPLWFKKKENGKVSLSLAAIGRTMYDTRLNDLADKKDACSNKNNLCEACTLFGMAGQEEKFGSRVRFTDAEEIGKCRTESKTLSVLGQPRHSYLPFYAKGKIESYDDADTGIAGRKFYWHNLKAAKDDGAYAMSEKNGLNSTMELVMPDEENALFHFNVYYDGITESQLKKLIWCINLGENNKDGSMGHKLGHGKPLGLGSVKMIVEERCERRFQDGRYEWERDDSDTLVTKGDPGMVNYKILMKILNMDEPLKSHREVFPMEEIAIEYPDVRDPEGNRFPEKRKKNEDARHNWYSQNKKDKKPITLPKPLEKDQGLPIYQKIRGQGDHYQEKDYIKEGCVYSATVTGYNDKKTSAYIKVNGQVKGSIYFRDVKGAEYGKIDEILPIKQEVKVILKEKKEKYVNFSLWNA